ncbi:hypothetical protein L9F63_015514, partial [Diploptera punctata]
MSVLPLTHPGRLYGCGLGRISRYPNREPPGLPNNVTRVSCGDLRECHVGMEVELCGRVQYQRVGRFLTLRDQYGMTQVVAPDDRPDLGRRLANMPIHSFVAIRGWVYPRPPGQKNVRMPTGGIEVMIEEFRMVQPGKKYSDNGKSKFSKSSDSKSIPGHNRLTSEEFAKCESPSVTSKFARRTHTCGDLTEETIGEEVHLCGWVELKRLGRFVTLRDGYGVAQLVAPINRPDISRIINNIRLDSIVTVKGLVCARPPGQKNVRMQTGAIEVSVTELEVVDPNEKIEPKLSKIKSDISMQARNFSTDSITAETIQVETHTHMWRATRCSHVGQEVTLFGWMEYQRMGKFVTIRDAYGSTQLVVPDDRRDIVQQLESIPFESIIAASGVVCSRPPAQENVNMCTGSIEVALKDFKVVNMAKKQLPFSIRDFSKVSERDIYYNFKRFNIFYIQMQRNLRIRSKVLMKMREYLCNHCDFVDVETPTLFRRTPGGAHEFVVPSRLPGQFYSLVQSPQQFKDELAKSDRQPEFTQLDIEMSFTDQEGVISLIEGLLEFCWPKDISEVKGPFPRITYDEAMDQYDPSCTETKCYSLQLKDVRHLVVQGNSPIVNSVKDLPDFAARAVVVPKGSVHFTTAIKNKYEDLARNQYPSTKLVLSKVTSSNEWEQIMGKIFSTPAATALKKELNPETFDLIMLVLGPKEQVLNLLGKLRVDYINYLESKGVNHHRQPGFHFLWVVDFPLFAKDEETGKIESSHHPFTQPHPEDMHLLQKQPLKVKSLHYDLVLNGCEVGGGSIRIHDPVLQHYVLKDILQINAATLQHLLDGLHSGCPPHGGIALGIDRLIAELCSAVSIRDVIAFPKTIEGKDIMSGAPVTIPEEEKQRYHIQSIQCQRTCRGPARGPVREPARGSRT